MEAHVLPHVGRMKAAAVSRGDVKLILARLSDRPACHNQALASLSAVFTWAITEEVGNITSNPCARIRRQVLPSRSRVLSDSEIVLLWEGLDVAWRLVLLTGQRPGEVLAMRAEDVRDGSWHLPGRPVANWPGTKNSCDHCIPLSDTAAALVDDHVANRRGRRGCEARLRQLWQRLGVDKIRPHDLRRSFGTMVCRFGFGRPAMDRLLNHSDRRVASIYDRYSYEAEDRRIVDAVARHVERVIAGVESNNIVRLR
jgi:integrase